MKLAGCVFAAFCRLSVVMVTSSAIYWCVHILPEKGSCPSYSYKPHYEYIIHCHRCCIICQPSTLMGLYNIYIMEQVNKTIHCDGSGKCIRNVVDIPKSWRPMPWPQWCKHNPFRIGVGCVWNLVVCKSMSVRAWRIAHPASVLLACVSVLARPRLCILGQVTKLLCGPACTYVYHMLSSLYGHSLWRCVRIVHIRRRRESSKCAAAAFGSQFWR